MSDALLAFLDLETGFENLILPGWEIESRKVVKKAARALERGYDQEAQQALDQLSMDAVIRRAQGPAKQLAATALMLGARNCYRKTNGESLGDYVAFGLDQGLQQFFGMVGPVLERHARAAARDEIDTIAWELKDQHLGADGGQVVVQKYDQAWVDRLNAAVDKGGRMMSSIAANLTTSRLVSYGFLAEATVREIKRYRLQAVLDRKTSQVCYNLNGREFEVATAYSFLRHVLQITEPDALKTAHPWLKADKATVEDLKTRPNNELQDKYGILVPPFHPHCRTVLETATQTVEAESFLESLQQLPTQVQVKLPELEPVKVTAELVQEISAKVSMPGVDLNLLAIDPVRDAELSVIPGNEDAPAVYLDLILRDATAAPGSGLKVLQQLTSEADKRGLTIRLSAQDDGSGRLIELYKSLGFLEDPNGGHIMERLPKTPGQ